MAVASNTAAVPAAPVPRAYRHRQRPLPFPRRRPVVRRAPPRPTGTVTARAPPRSEAAGIRAPPRADIGRRLGNGGGVFEGGPGIEGSPCVGGEGVFPHARRAALGDGRAKLPPVGPLALLQAAPDHVL